MRTIRSLADVVDRYDAVVCDVWGVIHDGQRVFPGAADALRRVRSAGIPVVLVTNVPRPGTTMPAALAELGFPDDAWDAVVTSGDLIRADLASRAPGPVHRLGRETDEAVWEGLGLTFVDDPDEAAFLAMAGLRDADEHPEQYTPLLRAARERDLELLCANPDLQVSSGDRLVWCPGAVAAIYEGLGGRVVQSGKPHDPIYEQVLDVIAELVGRPVTADRVLAVGDGIGTDIAGAFAHGHDSVFVASGMHGHSLLDGDQVDETLAQAALAEGGVAATYVMARLA
jgi:HAD superfamily hydrolase (TIGR01459 family)